MTHLNDSLPTFPSNPGDAAKATTPRVTTTTRIHLWDLPVRFFHWALLTAVSTAIVTGQLGGEWMGTHGKAGLCIIGLVVFRIIWGFLGSTYARFSTFVPTPRQLGAYLRGQWRGVGHNPLGALSVLALLGFLALQAGTGLFGNDDIAFTGPFAGLISESLSYQLTGLHHQLTNVLYVLIGLHVVAIAFYVGIKKDNLVKPMVTGWKDVPVSVQPPRKANVFALLASVVLALLAVYGASGLWIQSAVANTQTAVPSTTTAPVETPKW